MGINVLMRGWKRSSEIEDEKIRFRFLLKLCELSHGMWKFRQALAVFRDIAEPSDKDELKSWLLLGTQVWASNGDLAQGLKFFKRGIEGEKFNRAARILAIVAKDLKKAGAFEAAKSSLENMKGSEYSSDLLMIDEFIKSSEVKGPSATVDQMKRRFIIGGVSFVSVVILCVLYWLERRSLASLNA